MFRKFVRLKIHRCNVYAAVKYSSKISSILQNYNIHNTVLLYTLYTNMLHRERVYQNMRQLCCYVTYMFIYSVHELIIFVHKNKSKTF